MSRIRRSRFLAAGGALAVLAIGLSFACRASAEDKGPEKHYTVSSAAVPSPLVVGAAGTLRLTVTPVAPWILKMVTPLKVTLVPKGALELAKTELGKDDVEDPSAAAKTLVVGLTATAAGDHHVEAAMSFFLCTDEICQRHETTVTVAATAK